MKREYTAPRLIVESFQLNTDIASCSSEGGIPLGFSVSNCLDKDFGFFSNSCENDIDNFVQPGDKICYNGPFGNQTFINS